MASRIPSKEPTLATTIVACLVGTMAWILIASIYVGAEAGQPQFALSVFAAVAVCTVGLAGLVYAAHQQFVAKENLFSDRRDAFDYRTAGQWAVVTGATDGIGKAYARQLAKDYGMDLLLIGRNPEKLKAVTELISSETKKKTRIISMTIALTTTCGAQTENSISSGAPTEPTNTGPIRLEYPWYSRLRALIEGTLQPDGGIGVLVNCAGVTYPHPEYFASMMSDGVSDVMDDDDGGGDDDDDDVPFTADFCDNADAAIKCNVAAPVQMCRLVLPGMLARGRGLIINVGSASASIPPAAPLMALYAATKKFLEKLSADLDDECVYLCRDKNPYGVRVQCVRPAYVATAMLRSANPDIRATDDECEDGEADDADDYGDRNWWTARKRNLLDRAERWLVPSADKWVRSALLQGGRLYAAGSASAGPANFTGYWPHTLMVWFARLASAVLPRGWYVEKVLIPGMLKYRAKGRSAIKAAKNIKRGTGQ
ncbi:NAD(P)-binding domain,Short-chain dehydrogenase/reductase SDR [Cinara cedri]|uniref:NAD(P)-binding domain,Short-chain dehydrogenase/reductase SDR n=1 Tax=Cinara cedri TaxID=506608 RepID=A0A5E4M9N7_9HEMI|nr:NAD(P)-binding domain,Short-chain dehydrogenase/reductase SDR [Cinara cedri]